jgi:transcriptional regulator with AAA-type ATPase domain
MAPSFLQRFLSGKKAAGQEHSPAGKPVRQVGKPQNPGALKPPREEQASEAEGKLNSLFAFVDLKDPFAPGEVAGEELPGPILSIMDAKQFSSIYLFYTPHTRENALATKAEATQRYPECTVKLHELPIPDPKDYSSLMGHLGYFVRKVGLLWQARGGMNYVCVSSGTAEMRAAWFLLTATGVLTAKLLQVGTPARPLFGRASVKEVRLNSNDWENIRDLAMPAGYVRSQRIAVSAKRASMLMRMAKEAALKESPPEAAEGEGDLPAETLGQDDRTGETFYHMDKPEDSPDEGTFEGRTGDETLSALVQPEPAEVPGLDEALQELGIYVGSAVLRHAAEQAAIAAGSHLPVLLLGETGTGKEQFAKLIHRLSPRFPKEMVVINCAAIPATLAESYLFGHVKGAFSGATGDSKGMFESADRSTLFLDEIAELTPEVQAKLLRVIQDGVVHRIGTTVPRKVDVRIIAASNRDLRKEVSAGKFREDLYFRLDVVQIKLPALRERREEILGLAVSLLRQINKRRHKPRQLGTDALMRLVRYHWPGNVRELVHVLEKSVLFARYDGLGADDLLITEDQPSKDMFAALPEPREGFSVEEYLEQVRKQLFLRALATCKGNQSEAAELLGVSKQAVNKFVAGRSDNEG